MQKILIVTNETKDPDFQRTMEAKKLFEQRGITCVLCENAERKTIVENLKRDEIDFVLVIGGDGTLIEVAGYLHKTGVPLLGVNMGTLGYLTEIEPNCLEEAVTKLASGDYQVEERMMLAGQVNAGVSDLSLNDIVVSRKGGLRVIAYEVYVNGEYLNTYKADGIIISTPTGSTAYNLSAGGPIVKPTASLILLTPICSHALNTSSIVLADTDEITIKVLEGRNQTVEEAIVSFDGAGPYNLVTGDEVHVQKAKTVTKIIKLGDVSFLETLRRKMKGS
ncbi:NAD+ kinase [Lachnospiraceae bacterium PF1-21]|uniref:NAD(+)/NADH kinase n=1 Tax=Ohessyouella blattaphilus TaxID=2949333 RepID=UPI003E1B0F0B